MPFYSSDHHNPPNPVKLPGGTHTTALIAFILVLGFAGCSTYRNMTAYFNTYYNATKLFDQAVEELDRRAGGGFGSDL